jgi:mono/diheme cytochrome c family protein
VKHAFDFRTWRALGLALVVAATASACRQDMHDGPKLEPLEQSALFKDGRASRQLQPGTIARGQLKEDKLLYTGRDGDGLSENYPFPVTDGVLERGRERYNIYCTPCHARTGDGNGMIPLRGFKQPPTFHDERMRAMVPGYFVSVMTNGFGQMPSYSLQVNAEDRWAIAAYIKALQLSRHASAADLTAEEREKVERGDIDPMGDEPAPRAAHGSTGHEAKDSDKEAHHGG